MSYSVLITKRFEKELKRLVKKYPSLLSEFSALLEAITENPTSGVPLGNHCYKIRLAIKSKGKGKRGGARVITYVYVSEETVYLLTVYDKSEFENVLPSELKLIIESIELS
ncbi:MAG: type II toxin-antitoxin system RelE/ParE family toxin [Candidatus Kapabacteria bacterium]|nr:type II toxin-antitoxin system RelE/ParE family toxin [Candidatus Kapabacteria bacterium]